MSRLVLVLGDQLSTGLSALREADKSRDVIVMAEVADETTYVPHHPKKIALILASMRKFAKSLREDGWQILYSKLDDSENAGSICAELLRRAEETGATEVLATEPGEWRLIEALKSCPLKVRIHEDDRFIASHSDFDRWAEGRKALRMEYFYRDMRRKTGLLMQADAPAGGQWNFDHDNRKPAPGSVSHAPVWFEPDKTTQEVLDLVEERFSSSFGTLHPFGYATDRAQALAALTHFVDHALSSFGAYQDAILDENRFLYHSLLSAYLNIGLLGPLEVCQAVENAYERGDVPINSAEGFIRQIIGWREYMRGIYFHDGPEYTQRNALNHKRKLPDFYWGAETGMRCVSKAVAQTQADAYAHHIQRLMVTGNFALLAGVDPHALHMWYLSVYIDAFEWVEAPNTIGMSQFADGGMIASKPYVSSGNYITKMSDHCKRCSYDVKAKTGAKACPFNLLYWHFMDRHRDRFEGNPRMAQMYRTFDRMDADRRETVLREAQDFLDRMDADERV